MIKPLLLLFFLSSTLLCFAQPGRRSNNFINLKEDVLSTNEKNKIGNGVHDDADVITQGLHKAADSKILYLPQGTYLIKRSLSLFTSGLHIKGAGIGKTIIKFDSSYNGDQALLESNGKSNITIEDITFTGNSKPIKAALEFNSYPNRCKNINILHCEFANLWTEQAINFGGTSEEEAHSNDNVLIDHCVFSNIFNPSYKIVTNDTDPKCIAINLRQTTLRASIQYCSFQNISGDGIFGWGWSHKKSKADPLYGNWNIHHNIFNACWMCVEVNGNALGSNLYIHDNTMKCSTRNGGYLISMDSYRARIVKNKLYNVDRGLIEYTAIEGTISGNIGTIATYNAHSGGIPASEQLPRVACLELYGYNNLITRNQFTINKTNANQFSPKEYNGIKIIGKTTDTATQPLSYKGVTDYSAFWTITNNIITGFTHKAVDATNNKIRKVVIKSNLFKSANEQASPIEIYGYNWKITNNTFDLSGSSPAEKSYVVKVFYLQNDTTGSFLSSNKIINPAWARADHKYADNIR